MFIIYNSIEFSSFSKKLWYGSSGTFCKKDPLKRIGKKSVSFNPLVSVTNPAEIVNTSANLFFTAEFYSSPGIMIKRSRFITSSVFSTQKEIQDPGVRSLCLTLEKAFRSKVVLSTYPAVILSPCFSPGEVPLPGTLFKNLPILFLRVSYQMRVQKNRFNRKVSKLSSFPSLKSLISNSLKELGLDLFSSEAYFEKSIETNVLLKLGIPSLLF